MLTNPEFFLLFDEEGYTDKKSEQYYPLMLMLSLKCIVFHELGHIFNGHVDYIKEKNGKGAKLYENNCEHGVNVEDLGNIDAIIWQSMERNADDFAATRMVGQSTYKDIINRFNLKNSDHGLWLAAISQAVTYSLMQMGLENRSTSDYKNRIHLPLRFRFECILKTMIKSHEEFNGKQVSYSDQTRFIKAINRIEEWVNLFMENEYHSNLKVSIENNQDQLDESHRIYYYKVEKYYLNNLENELKNFSHMQILMKDN